MASMFGKNNPMWAGDKVGKDGLHGYIKRHLPKPNKCQRCHKKKRLDLANKTNKYLRNFNDWEWLCRRCHMQSDGRLTRMIESNIAKGEKLQEKSCAVCQKKLVLKSYEHTSKFNRRITCNRKCGVLWRIENGVSFRTK